MTRQVRRTILALTAFAAAGATEAYADPLAEKLCTLRCSQGTAECYLAGGSEKYCLGFAAGCAIGCKIAF